jgi:hypothetical protein
VYLALLDEGVAVWRPVSAEPVSPSLHRPCGSVPENKLWDFGPDEVIRCDEHMFSGSTCALTHAGFPRYTFFAVGPAAEMGR